MAQTKEQYKNAGTDPKEMEKYELPSIVFKTIIKMLYELKKKMHEQNEDKDK